MTNQTTQTMPAIEAAVNAGLASYHGVKTFSSEVRLRLALEATARAMLAAAPAASGVDTSTNEAWAARAQEKIEAMEAATGGEDDMCPNCVTPWKCNGPHESTGGASVSERARDDRFTAMLIGIIADVQDALGFTDEDKECSNGSLEIVAAIRELKEQALTQQRAEVSAGDAVFAFSAMLTGLPHVVPFGARAWATPGAELATAFNEANGLSVSRDFPQGLKFPEIAGKLLEIVENAAAQEDTTPQPSVDAVRELVKRAVAALTSHDQFNWALADPTLVDDLNTIMEGRTDA